MSIYLPIAELSANIFVLFGMGVAVGFLSGMFGVGGGFLMTPLLIFYNIPPAVAVATGTNQIVASSISGTLAHLQRGTIDIPLGVVLLVGGIVGSGLGVALFTWLRNIGQLDLVITILYVLFLGSIGTLMMVESVHARSRARPAAKATSGSLDNTTGSTACHSSALPQIEALSQRDSGAGDRFLVGVLVGHGRWRRLYHGSGADLFIARADKCCDRHLLVPDYFRNGVHHGPAVRRPIIPSTSCLRWC